MGEESIEDLLIKALDEFQNLDGEIRKLVSSDIHQRECVREFLKVWDAWNGGWVHKSDLELHIQRLRVWLK